ncbi:MAG: hypothetical protein ACRDLL_13895 [Solirubrobacterales bacterium]
MLVSQTIKDLTTGSGIVFTDRGHHRLKGVPRHQSAHVGGVP